MNAALPELTRIAEAWTEELSRALAERSAWAHLGTVEVASHRGTATLGGWIDRRVVGVGPSLGESLDAWRRTPEGRIVDRAVAQANGALRARLPDAESTMAIGEPWLDAAAAMAGGQGALVALGASADLVMLTRATLGNPWRARLHACPTEGRPGLACICAGSTGECVMVAMVSIAAGPGGVHVITVVDVKSKGQSRLARMDVRTAS